MDFTIHQYLLASEPSVLFAAGTVQQAEGILPQVKEVLNGRELPGFGYTGKLIPASSETIIKEGNLELQCFDYPSEVHLQNGLVCLEKNSGIFYSADLMLRYGNGVWASIGCKWRDEVAGIDEERIPAAGELKKLKQSLMTVSPKFVAVGHGFCVECEKDSYP